MRTLLALLLASILAVPAAAQSLRVTVKDAATGAPVLDALIRITGPDGALVHTGFSERNGVAGARLPAGDYALRVGRAGYETAEQPLRIGAGRNAVDVALRARPVGLDTVVVVVPGENERGREAFRRRQATANGVFLDPDYFQQRYRGARWIGDLLRGAPGIITRMVPRTGRTVVQNARQWQCFNVLVDGVQYRGPGPLDNWARPNDIVAVEIYHISSDVPPEYRRFAWEDTTRPDARPCGVILYWTRSQW